MTEVQEVKKPRAKRTKAAPKADLVEMAAVSAVETAQSVAHAQPALELTAPAPAVRSAEAGISFSSVQEQGDAFRQAMREAVTVSAQGAFEVNDKIIEALNVQSNAALDVWRSAINASHPSEAFQTQTSATRQAYATASAQWKDIAEATARWFTRSFEPFQTVLHRPGR